MYALKMCVYHLAQCTYSPGKYLLGGLSFLEVKIADLCLLASASWPAARNDISASQRKQLGIAVRSNKFLIQ